MGTAHLLGPLAASTSRLPRFSSRVPAGFPSPAQDHMEDRISLDRLLDIDAPHTYLVQAEGDSMTGAGIFDGDVLVVSRARPAVDGDIVIAALDGDAFVKRLAQRDGRTLLCSENPRFAARPVQDGDELLIWGVVVASIRRHAHG